MNRIARWLVLRSLRNFLKESETMNFLKAFFGGSKKASVIVAGLLTILFRDVLGLEPELVDQIVKLIIGYLFAQGVVDVALVLRGLKKS